MTGAHLSQWSQISRQPIHGHIRVTLTNALRGVTTRSPRPASHIATDHGRQIIVRGDWRLVFDDAVLDYTIAKMLKIEPLKR